MKTLTTALILITLLLTGCAQPKKAERILRQQGYTNITIKGWAPLMAGEDDTFSTGFTATSPNGEPVKGAVTSGFLKGSTVRLK